MSDDVVELLRIFISSPGDVAEERVLTQRVLDRLQGEYAGRTKLKPIFWEHEPLLATSTFQEQIPLPGETDIVVSILWSRLGTRLPAQFKRPDGSRYQSGTEFEFENAFNAYKDHGLPDLLVYRKTTEPMVSLKDKETLLEQIHQREALDAFISKWFLDHQEGTLIAAFHNYESTGDYEELVETHLRKLIDRHLPESAASAAAQLAVWQQGSPFRGLDVFDFEHERIFFGRTQAVAEVLQALRRQHQEGRAFLLVLGMSGGGKSSLVRAGVLPMLSQPGVIEGVAGWRRAVFRPGDAAGDLFDGLAEALLRDQALPMLETAGAQELAQALRSSPQAAPPLIKVALKQAESELGAVVREAQRSPQVRLVLVIDQMEEVFTRQDVDAQQRESFFKAIDALARCGRVWVIATLRSDYYPRCSEIATLSALKKGEGQFDLLPPDPAEIGQMIRLPARAAGLRFEEDTATNERLDDVLRDAAIRSPEALPLLEFTLEELYKRRDQATLTLHAYRELGGVEGCLAQRAEETFAALSPQVQSALPRVLHELVAIGSDGGQAVRRRTRRDRLASHPQASQLVDAFVEARLFVAELSEDGSATVSLAHEALLRHWPRLTDWLEENRESLRVRDRVAQAAQRWEAEGQSPDLLLSSGKPLAEAEPLLKSELLDLEEKERGFIRASIGKARRLQRLKTAALAALAVLTVVAIGAAIVARQQENRAEVEAQTAQRTSGFMVDLFQVSNPSEVRGQQVTAREILDHGAQRIESELKAEPEIQARMMHSMGLAYRRLGLLKDAAPLLEGALKIRREVLGEHHPDTIESLYQLATLQLDTGDYGQAEPLARQAMQLAGDAQGQEHRLYGDALMTVGRIMAAQRQFKEAEPVYREIVEWQRRHGSQNRLATALNNLGQLLRVLGKFEESEQLFVETLQIQGQEYGNEHYEVAITLANLAALLNQAGRPDEAKPRYHQSLEMLNKIVEEDHPILAANRINYGAMLRDQGDYEEAAQQFRHAVAALKSRLPANHSNIATGLNNLALSLHLSGDYAQAEQIYAEALEIARNQNEPDHPEEAISLTLLADLNNDVGRYAEAEGPARQAIRICLKRYGEGHWRAARAESVLGAALAGQDKQLPAAEELLRNSYEAIEKARGDRAIDTSQARERLIAFYEAAGRGEEAAQYKSRRPAS